MNQDHLSAAELDVLEKVDPEELKKVQNEYNQSSDNEIFSKNALIGIVGLSAILFIIVEFSSLEGWGSTIEIITLTVFVLATIGIVKKIGHKAGYLQGYRKGHKTGVIKALGKSEQTGYQL